MKRGREWSNEARDIFEAALKRVGNVKLDLIISDSKFNEKKYSLSDEQLDAILWDKILKVWIEKNDNGEFTEIELDHNIAIATTLYR